MKQPRFQIKLRRFDLAKIANVTSRQLGDVVKESIKDAGLTQEQAGIMAGIPDTEWSLRGLAAADFAADCEGRS